MTWRRTLCLLLLALAVVLWPWLKGQRSKPMALAYYDSATVTLTAGVDNWVAVVYDGRSSVQFIVNGSLVDTLAVSLRNAEAAQWTDLLATIADVPYGGRPADGTARAMNVDVRRERAWQRVLTLAELTTEAASSTPVSTVQIRSNVGLTSTADYTDTIGGHNFSGTNPYYTSTPANSGDGYVRFGDFTDGVRRSLSFLNLSAPFTFLWHTRIGTNSDGVYDLRLIGQVFGAGGTGFDNQYLYVGTQAASNAILLEVAVETAQVPMDTTTPCCGDSSPSTSRTSATGDILPAVDPAWTRTCAGGGTVPTAADLANSEDWSV